MQLVPDSALSLLMVSALGGGGAQGGPAPASEAVHRIPVGSAAAARAADMLAVALLYPAGSFEMISWAKSNNHDKALPGKRSIRFAILETCCLMLF